MKPILRSNSLTIDLRGLAIILLIVMATNFITLRLWMSMAPRAPDTETRHPDMVAASTELYLLDQARRYVYDTDAFESKVKEVSRKLDIPADWLMAVMHSESRFDASVKNIKGSGATGLIQFMPATAKDYNVTTDRLRNMNHIEQLDYVYEYLNRVRNKYKNYDSLTDLYLAILYPKALGEETCYTMYAKPSKAYEMNAGLDENKDGRVTVSDIDRRMKRVYPSAYNKPK